MELPLKRFTLDERCQARVCLCQEYAEELAEFLRQRDDRGQPRQLPPGVAFHDGTTYWLADGFHRHRAHELAGRRTMLVDVRAGGLREATFFAACTNQSHGLRRTNADRRKAVLTLLLDEEWGRWAAREIARRTGVSPSLVERLREQLGEQLSETNKRIADEGVRVERGGTVYTMRFRDMTASRQREAVEQETDRHRPAWRQEARLGLEQARRALVCLGGDYEQARLQTQAALDTLEALEAP